MKKGNINHAETLIDNILELLNEATEHFESIPVEIQEVLLKQHNENATLAYCLRWGLQAAEEIREDWHDIVSEIDIDED